MSTVTESALQAKTITPNLTVDDLPASIRFFEGLGFAIEERWEESKCLSARAAVVIVAACVSVTVVTAQTVIKLVDGTLFYYLTVVPENDAANFQESFRRIGESIRLTDAR